ncbi:MAG: beta-lactamase family protein [Armatimonadetes bacterium]|nr:beta-lactamase family protein [Armatimonadota bacterium]
MATGAAPGAQCWVWHRGQVVLDETWGLATTLPAPEPLSRSQVFDLASLTKALSTTWCVLALVDDGKLCLDQPLGQAVPALFEHDRRLAHLTPRWLLTHQAGLPPFRLFYRLGRDRETIKAALLASDLVRPPGTACEYSDLGFMLLGFAVEAASGQRQDIFLQERVLKPLGLAGQLVYGPLAPETTAATEVCAWRGALVRGEVHDENAAACGGVAGHAGLFATAPAAGQALLAMMQRKLLSAPLWAEVFTPRADVSGAAFWLGLKRLGYESGDARAFGHDGFTGTLAWASPERELVVALLTNRVHPTRENRRLYDLRPDWIAALARLAKGFAG